MQDALGVVGIDITLSTYTKNVAAFFNIVLHIVVSALVGELGQLDFLRRELLIQVEQLQTWWRDLLEAGWKQSGLQGWHGGLEFGLDEGDGLVFDTNLFVKFESLWNEVGVKFEKVFVYQSGEVFWQLVRLLQAAAEAVGQGGDIGNVMVLRDVRLLVSLSLEVAMIIEHPVEQAFLNFLVVFFFKIIVMQKLH